jgi:hypothetical protein
MSARCGEVLSVELQLGGCREADCPRGRPSVSRPPPPAFVVRPRRARSSASPPQRAGAAQRKVAMSTSAWRGVIRRAPALWQPRSSSARRDWISASRPNLVRRPHRNGAPLIGERAATRGRIAMGEEHTGGPTAKARGCPRAGGNLSTMGFLGPAFWGHCQKPRQIDARLSINGIYFETLTL